MEPSALRRPLSSSLTIDVAIRRQYAETLPTNILVSIFEEVLHRFKSEEDGDTPDFMHGGVFLRWNSNEHLGSVARGVCKAWEDAAQHVQYRSISVVGPRSAANFLRTISTAPRLARRVRSLVVGLGAYEVSPNVNDDVLSASTLAINVVKACTNLTRLQIRPLPSVMRPAAISALSPLRLTCLVLTPRLDVPDCTWYKGLWHGTDFALFVSPTLQDLELNFLDGESSLFPPQPAADRLFLTRAHIHADIPQDRLSAVFSLCGSTLIWLEFYSEQRIRDVHSVLLPLADSLEHLSFLTNPVSDGQPRSTPPAFNQFLPHCTKLQELIVASSDISVQALRTLPASLRSIEVFALSEEKKFVRTEELYGILRDPRVNLGGLQSLTVHDGETDWPEQEVNELKRLGRARGFDFVVEWDDR